VGEGEGPETEVTSGVTDTSEDELDGLDYLVDCDLADFVFLFMGASVGFFVRAFSGVFVFADVQILACSIVSSVHFSFFSFIEGISEFFGQIIFGDLIVVSIGVTVSVFSDGHLEPDDEWFGDEHPRDTDKRDYKQVVL